eukprot:11810646-Prorocentrum_lima.AAC.1
MELSQMPGVTPTNARDTDRYTDPRPMPRMHQPYQFLKQRFTPWGSAVDALNWEEAMRLQPKSPYAEYHVRVPIVGREGWPHELERTVVYDDGAEKAFK